MNTNLQRSFEIEIGIATTGPDDQPLPQPLYAVTLVDVDRAKKMTVTRPHDPATEDKDMQQILDMVTEMIRIRVYNETNPAPECPYCKNGLMMHPQKPGALTTCPDNRCLEWRALALRFNTDVTVLCKAASFRGQEFLII